MSLIKRGDRFGKLLVVTDTLKSRNGKEYCFVNCDCGKKGKQVDIDLLLSEKIKSCGCDKEKSGENNIFKHPLHQVWSSMIERCRNPKRPYYYLYGGRGIKVCDEWTDKKTGYLSFYDWCIQNGYKFEPLHTKGKTKMIKNQLTLDRKDVNGDYTPQNCKWVYYTEQTTNKRQNLIVEFNGEKDTCINFIKKFNATVPYFYYLLRQGNNEIQALEIISK